MKVYGDRGLVVLITTLEDTRMLSERGREKLMVFVRIGGKKKRGKKVQTVRKLKSNGMVSVVHESYFKVKVRLKKKT